VVGATLISIPGNNSLSRLYIYIPCERLAYSRNQKIFCTVRSVQENSLNILVFSWTTFYCIWSCRAKIKIIIISINWRIFNQQYTEEYRWSEFFFNIYV